MTHQIEFVKDDPKAVTPTLGIEGSVGYDLTAISVYKTLSPVTTLFDTGLKIRPPPGYYTEISPRSSISKTGYMLSNGVGVIDEPYRGRLLVALTKVDPSRPQLVPPFVVCQLVLKKAEYYTLKEVSELDTTLRGEGGFGSTNK